MCFLRIALMLLFFFVYTAICCSDVCKCTVLKSRYTGEKEQRVVCSPESNFTTLNELHSIALPSSVIFLVIQENDLSRIPSFSFAEFPGLRKLDLSKNNIFEIQDQAFFNLTSLVKLDLSHNNLVKLQASVFNSLKSLQRLNLEANSISRLSDGLLEYQTMLKVVNIGENPLICDCHLKWLIEWVNKNKVRLPPKSSCEFPVKLHGIPLIQLAKNDLHCDWPLQLPLFELSPHISQLVFQGDSLTLYCQVSNIEYDISIIWMLNEKVISSVSGNHLVIKTNYSVDGSLLVSSIIINDLQPYHSGFWKCHVSTLKGNDSQSVKVVVIGYNSKVCHSTVTVDNKGEYAWPETLAGITVELECRNKHVSGLFYHRLHAYHFCSSMGIWESLDTSRCPFVSEVTVVLEQFANANFSHANVVESARGLRNYTSGGSLLRDKMDIVFISRTLQNYVQAVSEHHEIAEIIVDVTSTILSVDRKLLKAAQAEDQACSRLMVILEQLSELLVDVTLNHLHDNIAVEEFFVKSEGFPGIVCTSFIKSNYAYKGMKDLNNEKSLNKENILHCNVANSTSLSEEISDSVEASLRVPATIFQQIGIKILSTVLSHKLQFIVYRNSLLFPHSIRQGQVRDITSSVISGKIAHVALHNLTEPVIVSLRTEIYTDDVRPVWWDPKAIGGKGDWSTDGCFVLNVDRNMVTFSCNHLANFGLLQDVDALLVKYEFEMAQFHPCHPAVYVGSFICVMPLIVTILVYCCGHQTLQMPKKFKHSFVNTFISLTLLCLVFSFGIYQTDIGPICQAIGLILHYLTLCSLLWMLITASNFYKKISIVDLPELTPDDATAHSLPPKPMLRFYLVGWGISSIICGISAAVHVENYGGNDYCFLSLNTSIGALYGPAVLMLIFLSFLYSFIQCALNGNCGSRNLSSAVDITDFEFTQASGFTSVDIYNDEKNSDAEEDTEYSYQSQLQGHATLLLLFLLSWLSAAAAIGRPFTHIIPNDELIFTLLFCLFISLMGIFVFFFFCHQREDAHRVLYDLFLHRKSKATNCDRTETVAMSMRPNTSGPSENGEETQPIKSPIVDHHLLLACDSDNTLTSNVQIFYDPRQSVVARRYFEKKRRRQQIQKKKLQKSIVSKYRKNVATVNSDRSNSSQIAVDSQRILSRSGSHKESVYYYPVCEQDNFRENVFRSCYSDVNVSIFSKPQKIPLFCERRYNSCDCHHRLCDKERTCTYLGQVLKTDMKFKCHCIKCNNVNCEIPTNVPNTGNNISSLSK